MRVLAALFLLALAVGARAQPFTVVASQPADHAVSVPLQTTLSLTFSRRVSDAGAAPTIVLFPSDAAAIGAPTRSGDGLTLTFPLALQPDTRYVALVLDAPSEDGAGLARPYALNFTTAATNGPLTVRGNVTATGGLAPDGSIVTLVSVDVATGAFEVVAADVVEGGAASLPYALGPVPFSVYTAGAVLVPFPLGASAGGFGYGLYDPNGDGTPEPILSPNGIDITIAAPPPRTAGDGLDEAQSAAEGSVGGPASLREISPAPVDTSGRSAVWVYRFQSDADPTAGVRVVRLGLFTLPVPVVGLAEGGLVPVPLPVDSDAALASAEADGGAAFRAAHPGETVTVTMSVDVGPGWFVDYLASGGEGLQVFVPFYVEATEGGPSRPRWFALRSANPSPGAVEATLTLDTPAEARVTVVDAQGRAVAVLLDGTLGAGRHAVRWTPHASAPAGVYWLRAAVGGRTEAVAVTRVR